MQNVTIYTTNFCPYCSAAKQLLSKKGAQYKEIKAGQDQSLRREMVKRANGGNTFPQIFIGDKHVGGCDDLYALDSAGGLDPLLAGK